MSVHPPIYLDHAATSPLTPYTREVWGELAQRGLGNASSLHSAGREARIVLELARESCAQLLEVEVEEVVFCSGATEANNLALWGLTQLPDHKRSKILYCPSSHPSILRTLEHLEQYHCQTTPLTLTQEGLIDLQALAQKLREHQPELITLIACNNETGALQDLSQVCQLIRQESEALIHLDAVQSPQAGQNLADLTHLADTLTLSGHKLGSIPTGLLFVRRKHPIRPLLYGGGQEDNRRAGTQDIFGAHCLAKNLERSGKSPSLKPLRQALETRLQEIPQALRLGPSEESRRAQHISAWSFPPIEAQTLLTELDLQGLQASSGSACSSHSLEPSYVLKAMGYLDETARGLVRFSFGWNNDLQQIEQAGKILELAVRNIRQRKRNR